ncbi:MAG: cell wall metabolism sensor histidine kinase WalK [Actinomycetota bacterium]|nr:cell wall metabolism sensor histidine kinase WalK [Actinomycetota bacterium]
MDIDALETFLSSLRAALREYWRAEQGKIPRKGGRPAGKEAAAAAFRLVKFEVGSGIATLAPAPAEADGEDLRLDDGGETLALTTLRQLLNDLDAEATLPYPVIEALSYARRAIGDNGHFGIKLAGGHERTRKVMIDEKRIKRLQRSEPDSGEGMVMVIGRLHMIEADPPNRRVGIRAQGGVDWTCVYADELHPVVTKLIERLVRVTGYGRRISAATGRLRIETLEAISEHAQDVLFTTETVPVSELRAEQKITRPQGLEALVDAAWTDDEESRRFLEATLGETKR